MKSARKFNVLSCFVSLITLKKVYPTSKGSEGLMFQD